MYVWPRKRDRCSVEKHTNKHIQIPEHRKAENNLLKRGCRRGGRAGGRGVSECRRGPPRGRTARPRQQGTVIKAEGTAHVKAPNSMQSSTGLGEGCGSPQSMVKRFPGGFTGSRSQHPALIGQTGLLSCLWWAPSGGQTGLCLSCLWWAPSAQLQFNPHPHSATMPCTPFSTFHVGASAAQVSGPGAAWTQWGGELVLQTPHPEHHPFRNLLKLRENFLRATRVPKPGGGTQLSVSEGSQPPKG